MLILYVTYTCFLDHKYTNIFVYILYVGKRFICELRMRETVAAESCPLFRVLRHRTPSSPICLSEVIHKPFALSRVFLLSSGGKSVLLVKKKAPSHSGFPASMHVVLKTRHVNLISTYVDIRATCVVQTYCHSSATFIPTQSDKLMRSGECSSRRDKHSYFI